VKQGGERLIVCARRAKKHAGRARHVMRAFLLEPRYSKTLGRRRYSKAVLIVISQRWLGRPFGGNETMEVAMAARSAAFIARPSI
jgi:hypothetical protein